MQMPVLGERQQHAPSMTRALMFWLLVPLLMLMAVSSFTTYRYAQHLAKTERDMVLEEVTDEVQDSVSGMLARGRQINSGVLNRILQASPDHRYFAIYDSRGKLLVGDGRMKPIPWQHSATGHAVLDTISLDGKELRRSVVKGEPDDLPGYQIQVAETMLRREALALKFSRGVLLLQAVVLVITFPLVWFGVVRGLQPLERLRQYIALRSAQDYSPMAIDNTPRELQPIVSALNGLLDRVDSSQDAQRRFTVNAAHQIKTPLAVLSAEIDLAAADGSCDCAKPTYRRLKRAVTRLTHLVGQLLALASSESAVVQVYEVFDLSALARDVSAEFVPAATRRNIDLGFESEDVETPIRGNAVLVREAMKNLVDNALKYTPNNGVITISLCRSPAVFSVADSGPGVSEADRTEIFRPFFRSTTASTFDGSGLGLAIVQEVANRHGATVKVGKSSLGGALFEIHFEPDVAVPLKMIV